MMKNEAKVIARAIESAKGIFDCYVIVDTGSTDDSVNEVRNAMNGIPGVIAFKKFVDFGTSRSFCLELARDVFPDSDYILVLDADEVLIDGGFDKDSLCDDMYSLRYTGSLDYIYPVIFKTSKPFYYIYPTHEVPACDEHFTSSVLPTLMIDHRHDGGMVYEKYDRDIKLLLEFTEKNPSDSRMQFYLANSYFDINKFDLAREAYKKRALMGGWDEEVFVSYLRAGLCSLNMGDSDSLVTFMMKAYCLIPSRPDPLYHLGLHYNILEMYTVADIFLSKAMALPYPADPLFFDRNIFDYLLDIEAAVCKFYIGDHESAIKINEKIISSQAPKWAKDLAVKNQSYSNSGSMG